MLDQVPVQAWLVIALAAIAYGPATYAYQHIAHSPARRDITRPAGDLSWRTSGQFVRSLSILGAIAGVAVFIFTPAAEQLAKSPRFLPVLMLCCGAWALFTAPQALMTGCIQPFVKGIHNTYQRETQPKRFWASLVWNGVFGCLCIWLAHVTNAQASAEFTQHQCYNEGSAYTPQDSLSACNMLLDNRDNSPEDVASLIAARGVAFHRLRDRHRAISDYSRAIRLNPQDSYSHYNRGLLYQELSENERAMADYGAAIRLRPDGADAYLNRGLISLDAGSYDEAVVDFTRAHELNPKDPWPLANRGIAYASKNDQARAEKDFDAVRGMDPANPVLLRGEALLRMNAGDMTAAVAGFTAALRHDSDNAWTLAMRAEAYRQLGQDEKSRADTNKLLQLSKRTEGAQLGRD